MALIKSARTHTHPLKTKKLIKVTETYRFNGEPSMARRRDLRRGACLVVACMVAAAAAGGGGGARSNKQASRPISFSRTHNQKKGKHTGTVSAPARDRLQLSLTWGEPHGGHGTDDFFMPSRDELIITSTINVGGETARYRSIFKRKGA